MNNVQEIAKMIFRHLRGNAVSNRHGVKFEAQDDFSMTAEARITSVQESVDIYYELFERKERFVELFKIKTVRDLYGITRNELKQLYLLGKASIVCRVDIPYSYFLSFRFVNGVMVAENERFAKHQVEEALNQTKDFIRYTRNYYALLNSCEN